LSQIQAAQTLTCQPAAVPFIVHAEGISERLGDITLQCSGGIGGTTYTGNFAVVINLVNLTNRIAANGDAMGVIFTADSGSGPVPVSTPGIIAANQITFNGFSFTLSPQGTVTLKLEDLRANITQLEGAATPVIANLSFSAGTAPLIPTAQLQVAVPEPGLLDNFSGKLICQQRGATVPSTPGFSAFIHAGAVFTSTRVTEGFAGAFAPKSDQINLNADTGTRILVRYSGFPSGAALYVPTVVAGSDATQPTSAGDLGLPISGGKYSPQSGGLLLSVVPNADATGAGGAAAYTPPASPGIVSFDGLTAVSVTGGSATVTYEVMGANPGAIEFAEFPTFLSLAPFAGPGPIQTDEQVSFAPLSIVDTADAVAPIPRFADVTPALDCKIVGDCGAAYFPKLYVDTTPLVYNATAGSGNQAKYVIVNNRGGGVLNWNAAVSYSGGASGWLVIDPASGTNNRTIRIDAFPRSLAAGTYQATLTVDGGALAGSQSVPVTLMITAPAATPVPTITEVTNAATFQQEPLVEGSLATIFGTNFSGKQVAVSVNNIPGNVLFSNAVQINFEVPAFVGVGTQAQVVVTVDGNVSAAMPVTLAPFSPGVFMNGILNQDNSVNGGLNPAKPGSIVQIFATGLSSAGLGQVTAKLGGQTIPTLTYSGPAPGLSGVWQVNLPLPPELKVVTTTLVLCEATLGSAPVCSPGVPLVIGQ